MFISGFLLADDDTSSKNSTDDSGVKVAVANVHQIDLDTLEVDGSGNWLNKRIWYERSQKVFDEIRNLISALNNLRLQFANESNACGQKIDLFFESVNFTKTDLDNKFTEILASLDTEKTIRGDLSEAERNLKTTVEQELPTIDQIGKDITAIGALDEQSDKTLIQSLKTIDECHDYETKAWNNYKEIAKELDDKKARTLYYQISNCKKNIEEKSKYLKNNLLSYLQNDVIAKIDSNISKINAAIETLKTKGIDLQKIMTQTEEDDVATVKLREKEAADIAVKKALEDQVEKERETARKAAKALAESEYNSFSNVVSRYVQPFLFNIGITFNTVYVYVSELSVVRYIALGIDAVVTYFHNLFMHVSSYFVKTTIKNKIKQVAETKDEIKAAIENKIQEKPADIKTALQEKIEEKTTEASDQNSPHGKLLDAVAEKISHVQDQIVAIQSLHQQQTKKETTGIFDIIKTFIGLIGTIFIGIYNFVIQFFTLIIKFLSYVSSAN